MNIIQDSRVFDKYFAPVSQKFKRDMKGVTEVIIHGTGGGSSAKSLLKWMLSGERAKEYSQGIALFHSEIDLNGDIYQIVPYNYMVFHSSSGQHDKKTIGIELVNPVENNMGPYTEEQYRVLIEYLKDLFEQFPSIVTIAGHGATKRKYSGEYKSCPGEFQWSYLEHEFSLTKVSDEIYSRV